MPTIRPILIQVFPLLSLRAPRVDHLELAPVSLLPHPLACPHTLARTDLKVQQVEGQRAVVSPYREVLLQCRMDSRCWHLLHLSNNLNSHKGSTSVRMRR